MASFALDNIYISNCYSM